MTKSPTARPLRFFDRDDDYLVVERELPHWCQSGTLCFITWRTADSMPRPVIQRWLAARDRWLVQHGISPGGDWSQELHRLSTAAQWEFQELRHATWEAALDDCHGACVLKRAELSTIVVESLLHFDEDRYLLTDYVVMPNHVHVLAAFADAQSMLQQCESWKHFTAVRINRTLGHRGRFWQAEGFDHLVRTWEQFEYLRGYIAENPRRASLAADEHAHYSRNMSIAQQPQNAHSRSECAT